MDLWIHIWAASKTVSKLNRARREAVDDVWHAVNAQSALNAQGNAHTDSKKTMDKRLSCSYNVCSLLVRLGPLLSAEQTLTTAKPRQKHSQHGTLHSFRPSRWIHIKQSQTSSPSSQSRRQVGSEWQNTHAQCL